MNFSVQHASNVFNSLSVESGFSATITHASRNILHHRNVTLDIEHVLYSLPAK